MPARRAASGLPPTATVRRPNVVRFSSSRAGGRHRGEHQDERRYAEDVGVAFAEVQDAVDGDDLGAAVGDLEGEAAGGGQHGEGGDERDHAAVCDQQSVDQAAAHTDDDGGEQYPGEAVLLRGDGRRPHGGERDDRADGQVDAAGGDHEGHADGDDTDHRRLREDQLQVAGVEELVGPGDAADHDERGEHPEQGQGAHVGAAQQCVPGGRCARRCRLSGAVPRW
ncbi:hypothetical protein GCM10020256_08730 [Streptomyces thermocoprophilus]